MAYFYEAGAVEVTWSPEGIAALNLSTGWAEDTFLQITPRADRVEAKSGAGGQYTFSKIADKGCDITMTFTQEAPVNAKIAAAAAVQDVIGASLPIAPFTVIDNTGDSVHFIALNAVLTKVPEETFGRASGEKSWGWTAESYLLAEDLTTITAALDTYIVQSTNI